MTLPSRTASGPVDRSRPPRPRTARPLTGRCNTATVLVRVAAAVALSAAALAGCSGDDGGADVDAASDPYAGQTDGDWQVQEAVDLAADDPLATRERPPLDWYGEYVRSDHTEMIRLSGHDASLGEARSEYEQLGFELSDVTVRGWGHGVAGNHPTDASSPEVLLVPSGSRTLMALSYDVPLEVLLEFMGSVEGAERDEWVDAGGVIR